MTGCDNELKDLVNRHRNILDHLHEGAYMVDRDRNIIYWNAASERISGYTSAEVVGSSCASNILVHVDGEGHVLCDYGCPLKQAMEDSQTHDEEVYLHHKQGHRVPVQVRTTPLLSDGGGVLGGLQVFSETIDQSALREEVDALRRLALKDELTEIGNRRYVEMALQSRHSEFDRYEWKYGVLMIDIDHFKRFNDQYGHDIGDRVLKMVATTLASNVRTFDVVGRWGGEEFVAVIEKIDVQQLTRRAEILRRLVETSGFDIDNQHLSVTTSTGGTIVRSGEDAADTLKRADELLYRSKESGRNRCTIEAH